MTQERVAPLRRDVFMRYSAVSVSSRSTPVAQRGPGVPASGFRAESCSFSVFRATPRSSGSLKFDGTSVDDTHVSRPALPPPSQAPSLPPSLQLPTVEPIPAQEDRMAAQRQQIESAERSKAVAARSRRRRRIAGTAMKTAILIAAGISLVLYNPLDLFKSKTAPNTAPSTFSLDTAIETSAIRFAMPGEPIVDSLTSPEFDMGGTVWTFTKDDLYLNVLLVEFPVQLNQDAADGSFDAGIGGMARRSNGTVTTNEPISSGDPIMGRRAVIEVDGGQLYTEMYAHDRWVVQMSGATERGIPPAEYTAMLDSFAWQR